MQPKLKSEHTRGAPVESLGESGTFARQRRRTSDTSTVGDMSIDLVVPESSTVPPPLTERFKAIRTGADQNDSDTRECCARGDNEHAMTRSICR